MITLAYNNNNNNNNDDDDDDDDDNDNEHDNNNTLIATYKALKLSVNIQKCLITIK